MLTAFGNVQIADVASSPPALRVSLVLLMSRQPYPCQGPGQRYRRPVVLIGVTRSPDAAGLAVGLAAELLGRHPGPLHHHCPTCGSIEHGRPSFDAPVQVSIAHTSGLSVVAVSSVPIGIDVERDAAQQWVRAEAIGKAYGVGLTGPDRLAGGDALVVDLDLPGYVAALAVRADELPPVRLLAVPEEPAAPANR